MFLLMSNSPLSLIYLQQYINIPIIVGMYIEKYRFLSEFKIDMFVFREMVETMTFETQNSKSFAIFLNRGVYRTSLHLFNAVG